jgi:hypothetical protein
MSPQPTAPTPGGGGTTAVPGGPVRRIHDVLASPAAHEHDVRPKAASRADYDARFVTRS